MNKKIKKIFLLMTLSFAIALPNLSANNLPNLYNKVYTFEDIVQDEKFIEKAQNYLEEKYGENYMEILNKNATAVDVSNKISDKFTQSLTRKSSNQEYPNFFGGKYINDNDELVIQIVEENIPEVDTNEYKIYDSIINISEDVKIEYVKNSYKTLVETNDKVVSFLTLEQSITASYIDVINNVVVVELRNNTEEEINHFKENVINSPVIRFIKGKELNATATLNVGSPLSNGNANFCSVAYRATYNGTSGFVTAGHCTGAVNSNFYSYGTVLRRSVGGALDGAFISSSYTVTHSLNYSGFPVTSLSTTTSSTFMTVGQKVGRVGYKTEFQTGKITKLNWSGNVSGYSWNNLVETDVYHGGGDSGGAVFTLVQNAQLLGIANIGYQNPSNYMVFSKVDFINNALGVKRY